MATRLLLLRHAPAEPRHEGIEDAERPLTRDGRRRFEDVVRGLDRLDLRFDRLYHSPWTRAGETAEMLEPLVVGDVFALPELTDAPGEALLQRLEGESVAVVGHEPWIGQLVALLLHGEVARGAAYRIRKGGVAWLDGQIAPGGMRLCAFLPPKVLRAIR